MQIYMLSPTNTVIPISPEKAAELGAPNRQLATTDVRGFRISTVFLGIDHDYKALSYDPVTTPVGYKPLIFETMIFGGSSGEYQTRYRDYKLAMAWHDKLVAWMEQGKDPETLDMAPDSYDELSNEDFDDEIVI